jgi:SAM-dependent methyltransferase
MMPKETDLVLDLGTANLPEPLESIFEYYYPFKHRIVAAGTEDCNFLEAQYLGLQFVHIEAGKKLPFPDNMFDIGFSNATIEHVGSHDRQAMFLRELLRVCRRVFVSTPNRWFPIELHTRLPLIHWLSPRVFRALIGWMGFHFYAKEENLNLLSARDLVSMLPVNEYKTYLMRNYFLGMPSNLILIIEKTAEDR